MFTDAPVTPVRLTVLLDLLRGFRQGITREDIHRLLQPESLTGEGKNFDPAKATLKAGVDLGLVKEDGGTCSLTPACRQEKDTVGAVLKAIDDRVLTTTEVEKYFALFFSYYLGLGTQVYRRRTQNNQQWADQFNRAVFADVPQGNPFNATKVTGLHRWFSFAGLGWYDPSGTFQANPYDRLQRALPGIFKKRKEMDAEEFMAGLRQTCPELDGGALFETANKEYSRTEKKCTLGLSHALVELHLDGIIALNCPADSAGWSIEEAEPPHGKDILSTRFSSLEYLVKG